MLNALDKLCGTRLNLIESPSEKILGEIRLNLTFHSENAKCDPAKFKGA
jgi:hypothetical protein